MKTMKAKKYNCHFKGLAITNSPDLPNPDEFNHEESIITAFSFEDALSQWLRKMWDISLSINIPCSLNDEIFNYGETYEEFIASKDVEFNLFKLNENHNRIEIKYKGRNDFYYEISIQKQLEENQIDYIGNDFYESDEFKPVDYEERDNICEILPSGVTYTLNSVVDWVKENLDRLKKVLHLDLISSSDVIKAYVWAYRYDNGMTKYISFDLHNEELNKRYSFTFAIGGEHSFHLDEPTVPDCIEAIHMIGLITTALKIKAVIGLYGNEVNEYCTANIHLEKVS